MTTLKIGFLASHRGSVMQAIVHAARSGRLDVDPRVVVSNNGGSQALAFARREGLAARHVSGVTDADPDAVICDVLDVHGVDLVVLGGYMKRLGPRTLSRYAGRILNTHPSLLPRFGGRGMYGDRVHEAVLAAGEARTGVTIHLVDEEYDQGPILGQVTVDVLASDTVDSLRDRVQARERAYFVELLGAIAAGTLVLPEETTHRSRRDVPSWPSAPIHHGDTEIHGGFTEVIPAPGPRRG